MYRKKKQERKQPDVNNILAQKLFATLYISLSGFNLNMQAKINKLLYKSYAALIQVIKWFYELPLAQHSSWENVDSTYILGVQNEKNPFYRGTVRLTDDLMISM